MNKLFMGIYSILHRKKRFSKKGIKYFCLFFVVVLITYLLFQTQNVKKNILYVYNWGLYIDESTIQKFTDETGIQVVYDMFDTNEEMYAKIKTKSVQYDVLCPTDYMIEKMMKEDMLYSFDITTLNNYKYLDKNCLDVMKLFDLNNHFAVPYVYSTIGIVYNKTILDKKKIPYPKTWADLFKKCYKGELILQDAVRDLLMVGLYKNGYSLNSKDDLELKKAEDDLIEQKKLVYAYLIDLARDKIAIGEASVASMYSGEMEYIKQEGGKNGYEFEYVIPKEAANLSIDAWCIPQNAKNKENAIKWIDFMTRPDIAKINYDYMHYGTPNTAVRDSLDVKEKNDAAIFPDLVNGKYELYKDLGEYNEVYLDIWKRIKSQ